jgi:signal recognition particle receptor subunit beta
MRIGEIAVIGPSPADKRMFISSICDEVEIQHDSITFGRLTVNDELAIHLYGLDYSGDVASPSWDLVSRKLLGYVLLFAWNDSPKGLQSIKTTIDSLTRRYQIPLIVNAHLSEKDTEIPTALVNTHLDLSDNCFFTFCRLNEPDSVRKVLLILVNHLIDKL